MAYSITSAGRYSKKPENAMFFSQELIEYILFDFGHMWKPMRSKLEISFRKSSMFVFWPSIGRLVTYISRKYSGFVVIKSFEAWKFINGCRPSVRKQLLYNAIVNFSTRHELDDDDLGLFTFLAVVVEYARLAITYKQEKLIDTVVDALSFCLTTVLSSGFVHTLNRLKSRASKFKFPRNYVMCDYDPQTQFLSPVNTDPMFTSRSEVEFPISVEFHFPSSLLRTPPEDVTAQLKIRKVHGELFRRQMMTDQATQTEVKGDHNVNKLRFFAYRHNKIKDLSEKIKIKNNSDSLDVTFSTVEMYDVYVQTWSSGEQLKKLHTETDKVKAKKTEEMSRGAYPVSKHASDLIAAMKKVKTLEKIPMKGQMPERSHSGVTEIDDQKPQARKILSGAKNSSTSLSAVFVMPLEHDPAIDKQSSVHDKSKNPEKVLQCSEIKCPETDTSICGSFNESQFESFDVRTDDPTKIRNEQHSMKNSSFDSQSLDESI